MRNNGVTGGSLRLTPGNVDGSATPVSPVFTRVRRTQTVRYRRRSKRQGPSISQLVPVLLEGKTTERTTPICAEMKRDVYTQQFCSRSTRRDQMSIVTDRIIFSMSFIRRHLCCCRVICSMHVHLVFS